MRIGYYAVFNYDEYDFNNRDKAGIAIHFPDFEDAYTCSTTYLEGIKMSVDILALVIIDLFKIKNLPKASSKEEIDLGKNEELVYIEFDTDDKNFMEVYKD